MELPVEAVQLDATTRVVATSEKFQIHRLGWQASGLGDTLPDAGQPALTRQLLAGALYAGMPVRTDAAQASGPACSPLLWHIHNLAASYQTTRATPPTLRKAAERLASRGEHAAAQHCLHVAEEETGHDLLALKDLASLGLPAQRLVQVLQPPRALALVALFGRFAESEQPIATLGYAYVLERAALFTTAASIAAIEAHIPRGIHATRCLRVHSAVGSDAGHVQQSLAFMSGLRATDRATIARAVFQTARLMFDTPGDYPGDAAMQALLAQQGCSLPVSAPAEAGAC